MRASAWIGCGTARAPAALLAWLAGSCVMGFVLPWIAVDRLALPREAFVLVHLLVTGPWLLAYGRWIGAGRAGLARNAGRGLLLGALAAAISVQFVLAQASSPGPQGPGLAVALLWSGLVYGTLDAALLTLLPVHAAWCLARGCGWRERRGGWLVSGLAALAASVAVTVAWHLGFPEFRGPQLLAPVIGNTVFTLAYLLGASPLAPVLGHVALHLAAALHAPASSPPLPPHY